METAFECLTEIHTMHNPKLNRVFVQSILLHRHLKIRIDIRNASMFNALS